MIFKEVWCLMLLGFTVVDFELVGLASSIGLFSTVKDVS
jgi:hypothetical protein